MLFVVAIDGPDFCGKTTISNLVLELLRKENKGKKLFFRKTALPSDFVTGSFTDILRSIKVDVSSRVFALAYALDHLYHYENFIKKAETAKENIVVIQERSLLTSLIYQGLMGDVEMDWLREINKFDKNIPDLTIILKVSNDELLKRKAIEKKEFDRFEVADHLLEQTKVYYNLPENLIKEFNVKYVDGNADPWTVAKKCIKIINEEIKKKFKA